MNKTLFFALLVPALVGCRPPPTPIPFESDAILRGVWTGTEVLKDGTAGRTLTLKLTPTYINKDRYSVSGTGKLNQQDVTVSGQVDSGLSVEFLAAQTMPINPSAAFLPLMKADGSVTTLLCDMSLKGNSVAEGVDWSCHFASEAPADYPILFPLKKESP